MVWNLKYLEENLLVGSTLVEGSTLSEAEAIAVLAGRTVSGHPIAEIRGLTNYRAAVEWLIERFEATPALSVELVLKFHSRLMTGLSDKPGKWKSHRNFTYLSDGSRYNYLHPAKVGSEVRGWVARFNQADEKPAARVAAALYFWFQHIHPFDDGNGRIGRVLIACWLHWHHRRSFRFFLKDRIDHLNALEAAGRDDQKLLERFFTKRTVASGKRK